MDQYIEQLHSDRDGNLEAIKDRRWGAVIDTSTVIVDSQGAPCSSACGGGGPSCGSSGQGFLKTWNLRQVQNLGIPILQSRAVYTFALEIKAFIPFRDDSYVILCKGPNDCCNLSRLY